MDPKDWEPSRAAIAWLRQQDPAFRAVVVGGVGLVAFVALVVGIAVAAIIGAIVLADGGGADSAPADASSVRSEAGSPGAEVVVDGDADAVTVTFEGGDELPAGDVYVELDHGHEDHVHREAWAERTALAHDEPIPPGSTVTVGGVQTGDVLRVVYRPGDESQVLVEYTV